MSWAAFITPVVMAGALWLMTRSPYALAFAALGPVGAVISLVEGRRGGGRERRAALAERADELERLRQRLTTAHDGLRRALELRAPGGAAALAGLDGPALWKGDEVVVSLGRGVVESGIALTGDAREPDELELQRAAARLDDAPVLALPEQGVAVCGPDVLARAYLRGLVVQLYAALAPGRLAPPELVDPAGWARGEWDWLEALPHHQGARGGVVPRFGVFPDARLVPPGFHAVVSLASPIVAAALPFPAAGQRQGGRGGPVEGRLVEASISPELVGRAEAERFAAALSSRAAGLGLGAATRRLPGEVAFGDLPAAGGPRLGASIGRTLHGIAEVDLVADGPHAVVAGVTGSGKSELLVTWVAGMVSGRSSAEVVVLLVDFKGGTAFRPLAALPHVVGVVTDLQHGEAARALSSLSAELRRREAELARLGVRDVAEAGAALPRLVIVVDEFAAMIDAFPDFGPLFADIAARGRALGIHLILATQRPAGVMRDALVANCPLRLSLRVQSDADSRWVVGTDAASRLSASTPGRCILSIDGVATEVQIARTTGADLAELAAAAAPSAAPPRRPWLDPLPAVLTRAELPAGAGPRVVGLADLPEQQQRALLQFLPEEAPIAVLGAARSGKSSLLRLLADASGLDAIVVGADREQAWDAVEAAADRCEDPGATGAPALLLAVDDADAVCARLGEEYAAMWCERLARVLRDGPAAGVHAVVAAQRQTGPLRSALGLARETVLLRQASRQEHVLAGAPAELWDEALPAGGAIWRGRRVQFLAPAPHLETLGGAPVATPGEPPARVPLVPARGSATVLVSRAPARVISRARAAGLPPDAIVDLTQPPAPGSLTAESLLADGRLPTGVLLVGDPEAWLGRWSLFAALKTRHPIVFSGCDAADVRALTRSRALPPPLAPASGAGWLVFADGRVRRCVLEAA
jgi:S-DNA-T family DNA segregation ATPase FtsK/SpoIIIE